ncbi:hypothetical protein ScPMuIL_011053 [Solemya velum]
MSNVEDLKSDIEELRGFVNQAERQKVKDLLGIELRKLETELIRREEALKRTQGNINDSSSQTSGTTKSKTPVVQLKNYAWDQSDKFMKIYVTVNGVHSLPKDNITCQFSDRSFKMIVKQEQKIQELYVSNLMEKIDAADSFFKVKTDTVLLMLKKTELAKTWPHVKQGDAKTKEKKSPKMDKDKDPQEGLMDMMKQMYDEGDDEMKRTIAKAWSESRQKQGMDMDL